ncbi:MAG TPA: right-handed parallel beta-helix repeat-containing protein [Candidatus Nitrosotalea sp.]|nr:right-handed parallel beta-helix repeat-containing protein [Candidatus Nitrosotalea sp.]
MKVLSILGLTALGTLIIFSLSSQSAYAYNEIHVPSDYSTIQAAIDAANAGDYIIVDPGTYSEQISVSKSLHITSSNGTTIIKAPSVLLPDTFGTLNVVDITNGATVTISQVTISGPGPTTCNSIQAGIFVSGGATLKITNSTITDIRDNPIGGCQNGDGILVGRAKLNTIGHAEISNVVITRYQKGGIVIDGIGTTAFVKNNDIVFGFFPVDIAANGIQISRGAQAMVLDNQISQNICSASVCGPDITNPQLDQAAGILLYGAGNGTVVNYNTVSQNDIGIGITSCGDPFCLTPANIPSVEIKNNIISNSGAAGILIKDENYIISNNQIKGPGLVGIAVISGTSNTVAVLIDNQINDVITPIETFSTPGHSAVAIPSVTSPSSLTIITVPSFLHTPSNSSVIASIPTQFPGWVKNLFTYYAQGNLSYDDLIKALQFLSK